MQATKLTARPSRSLRFIVEITIGETIRTYLYHPLPDQTGHTHRCRLVGRAPLCAGELIDCGINSTGPYCLACTNPGEKPCHHIAALTAARLLPPAGTTQAAVEDARLLLQEQQRFFETRVAEQDDKITARDKQVTAQAELLRNMQIALDAANGTTARLQAEAIDLRRQRRELDDDLTHTDDMRNQAETELAITRAALAERPAPRTRRTRQAATSAA